MTDPDLSRLGEVPQHVKDKYLALIMTPSPLSDEDYERMLDLGEQIRSALTPPPRRTRAERDREVVESLLCVPLPDLRAHGFGDVVRLLAEPVRDEPVRTMEAARALIEEVRASPTDWEPLDHVGTLLAGLINRIRHAAVLDWGDGSDWTQPEQSDFHERVCELLGFAYRPEGQSGVEYASEDLVLEHIRDLQQQVRDLQELRARMDDHEPQPAPAELERLQAALGEAAQQATAALRTRAEVDAEIAAEVRCWRDNVKTGAAYHSSPSPSSIEKFERLCAEPVRGDDPPQPERMTEALRDLCRSLRAGGSFGGAEVAMYIEACFPDERRQQTKGATEPDARLPGSMRAPGTAETSVAPAEPERCTKPGCFHGKCEHHIRAEQELSRLRTALDTAQERIVKLQGALAAAQEALGEIRAATVNTGRDAIGRLDLIGVSLRKVGL